MSLLRHVALLAAAVAGVASAFLPVQDVDLNHPYGHPCSEPFLLAPAGLFVPALIIAIITAARLATARAPSTSQLPRAAVARGGASVAGAFAIRARVRGRLAELDARLAAMGRFPRTARVCAWIALLLGVFLVLGLVDGPGAQLGALAHLLSFALVIVGGATRAGSSSGEVG